MFASQPPIDDISGIAKVLRLAGHNQGIDCFNRVFECSIRVYGMLFSDQKFSKRCL